MTIANHRLPSGVDTTPDPGLDRPSNHGARPNREIIAGRIKAAVDAGDFALVNELTASLTKPQPPGPVPYSEELCRSLFGGGDWVQVRNTGALPMKNVSIHEGRGGVTFWHLSLAPNESIMMPRAMARGLRAEDPVTGLVIGGLAPQVQIDGDEPALHEALVGALGARTPPRKPKADT